MDYFRLKAVVAPRSLAKAVVKVLAMAGLATLFPLLGNQFLAGPLVNAVLFISVFFLDIRAAVMVGLLPSIMALSIGLLPSPLAPMIPFIMAGNAVLVIAFYYLKGKNFWLGIGVAGLCKYVLLHLSSILMIGAVIKGPIAAKIAAMMSWPQLVTALAGGVLAFMFLKIAKRM